MSVTDKEMVDTALFLIAAGLAIISERRQQAAWEERHREQSAPAHSIGLAPEGNDSEHDVYR
jgi:hypothetical protein